MLACVVISSSKFYIEQLSEKYECTLPDKMQHSFKGQLTHFLFNLDAPGERRESEQTIRLYHAWCERLEKSESGGFAVRLSAKVHKYCGVYAVAVRFKEPGNWVRFLVDMDRDCERSRKEGFYHRWEKLGDEPNGSLEDGDDDEGVGEDEDKPVLIDCNSAESAHHRLDLYATANATIFLPDNSNTTNE